MAQVLLAAWMVELGLTRRFSPVNGAGLNHANVTAIRSTDQTPQVCLEM
jgi:hypothetical protein